MPKKLFKRYLPHPDTIKQNKSLQRFLGHRIHDPNLWHLNRRSVSSAFFVGVFCAFIPIPFQMVVSAFLAFIFRCNLPISVALVWITNPVTMPAIFYFTYKVGCFLLNTPVLHIEMELTTEWVSSQLANIWQPLYFGSIISGVVLGLVSYFLIRVYWRWHVAKAWQHRKKKRKSQPHDRH
ncbi:DUF2062 domain-containing protein [Endozoicomonas sp. SM1973]|uniref:DUF2062 domain-containing protein n=1 Tax=Spartinivicinus marinus TaxID=2994442 RepID=A0A853HUQ2_9GAMM|nr:DUF2062 domain-containing protein [Spartinivicinus marinus]MCX4029419.1 DUF2062 domain-containing protein [Spartinivicinus marinus]NYZ64993.1 DUF2062 domain-containing protein [Spartinivicinus marinus]